VTRDDVKGPSTNNNNARSDDPNGHDQQTSARNSILVVSLAGPFITHCLVPLEDRALILERINWARHRHRMRENDPNDDTIADGSFSCTRKKLREGAMDFVNTVQKRWKGRDDFLSAQGQVVAVLLIAYIGNNWEPSYPRNDNHSMPMFWTMNGLILIAALATMKHDPDGSARGIQLLSRHQTEEWKGWMQWAFIMVRSSIRRTHSSSGYAPIVPRLNNSFPFAACLSSLQQLQHNTKQTNQQTVSLLPRLQRVQCHSSIRQRLCLDDRFWKLLVL
jgi:hypothetical protein